MRNLDIEVKSCIIRKGIQKEGRHGSKHNELTDDGRHACTLLFLLIRPQKKREKKVQEMRSSLKVGDKVITIGGIHGKIVKTGEDFITIEVGSGDGKALLEVSRWGVGTNLSSAEE